MPNLIIPKEKLSRKFIPFFNGFKRYEVIFGGRGSSKSTHIAIKLLARAAVDEYFHCIYVRKWGEHIRDSQFELFKRVAQYMGWENEFKFSESTFTITCIRNGNKMIAKGLDKADKTKSIAEPTHVWVEEADQITFDDFDTLNKGLRTSKTQCSFLMSFNTFVPEDHWIRDVLFDKENIYDLSPKFKEKSYLSHSTYLDNDFIDHEEYEEILTIETGGNKFKIESDLKGVWGVEPNDFPWLYAFDESKHVKKAPFLPTFPIYIFIDINNEPLECTIWQMSPNKGTRNSFLHCIDVLSGSFKIEELCERILSKYPFSIKYLGGDRSGQNEDVGRNQTIYQIMASLLGLGKKQLLLNTHNLEHSDSRILCNAMLSNYPNVVIDESCKILIKQCHIAKVDQDSSRPSQLLKDRGTYKLDAFDSMRYMFQTLFNEFAKETYFKVLAKGRK